jgi:uncharacterized protein YjbI with pentapeptide repeats
MMNGSELYASNLCPGSSFIGTDLSNVTLSGEGAFEGCSFEQVSSLENIQGRIGSCPSLPPQYSCFHGGRYSQIVGPDILTEVFISSGNPLEGQDLSNINLTRMFISSSYNYQVIAHHILACPLSLDERYHCVPAVNNTFSILGARVIVQDQTFDSLDLSGSDLSGSDLSGSTFINSNLTGINLSGSELSGVSFIDCNLDGVNFSESILVNASFSGSSLEGIDVRGADLRELSFEEGTFNHAKFDWKTSCPNPEHKPLFERCDGIFSVPCTWSETGCPDIEWVEVEEGTLNYLYTEGIEIESFELMKNEITVGQMTACYDAGFCPSWDENPLSIYGACNFNSRRSQDWQAHPANCLSYIHVVSFANWLGSAARLPSYVEWQFATNIIRLGAVGERTQYPWGNEEPNVGPLECTHANIGECYCTLNNRCSVRTSPVCHLSEGNTSSGICDMIGNVSEWLEDEQRIAYHTGLVEQAPYCAVNNCIIDENVERALILSSYREFSPQSISALSKPITYADGSTGGRLAR